MATSKIAICNFALGHLGTSKEIASFTEKSKEARACNRFYNQVRDEVLRDFPWPFARRFVDLQLVETEPTGEWAFSYRYPADCLKLRRILNPATRNDTPETRIKHIIAQDDNGLLVFTDLQDAEIEYTVFADDPTRYHPDFVQAFACLLASYISPSVTGGNQFKLGDRAMQLYQWRIGSGKSNALSEEVDDLPPESGLLASRDSGSEDSRWSFR